MATNKRVFTLRLPDEVLEKIGMLATQQHRSVTNYIEFVLLQHLEEVEREHGSINIDSKDYSEASERRFAFLDSDLLTFGRFCTILNIEKGCCRTNGLSPTCYKK